MTPLVPIALFGWLPLAFVLFTLLPLRRAMMITVLGGWLFLPVASYSLPGLPDFTKAIAVSLAALLGLVLFGSRHLADLRPGRLDLPMAAWCAIPAASSLANGHGAYDAAAATVSRCLEWGIPYLVGRALFRDLAAIAYLARCVFIGGLIYVPLCLYEIRMSPQLHATLYGFAQHSFLQHIRLEGYRPLVFMEHGLMVGLWMSVATIAGAALWQHGGLRRVFRAPVGLLLAGLFLTTVLCKSMGALTLLGVGLAVQAAARRSNKAPLYVLIAWPALFVAARLGLGWQAEGLIACLKPYAPERASSLWFRVQSEQAYLPGVWQRPLLGWSSWGFVPTVSEDAELTKTARDSFWLITLVASGLIGLVLSYGIYVVPILTLVRRLSARAWLDRRTAGATAMVVALCLCVSDNVFNAMINPVYTLALGGITGLAAGLPVPGPLPAGHRRRAAGPVRALPSPPPAAVAPAP